jgi:hypothetical protein
VAKVERIFKTRKSALTEALAKKFEELAAMEEGACFQPHPDVMKKWILLVSGDAVCHERASRVGQR